MLTPLFNKKRLKSEKQALKIGFLTLIALFFIINSAKAQFSDNFENYSLGNLNGQFDWVDETNAWQVVSDKVYQGTRAIKITDFTTATASKTGSITISEGLKLYFYNEKITNPCYPNLYFRFYRDSGTNNVINLNNTKKDSENCLIKNQDTAEELAIYSINNWHKFEIEWKIEGSDLKWRIAIDDGSWSAWQTKIEGGLSGIDTLKFYYSYIGENVIYWIDKIERVEKCDVNHCNLCYTWLSCRDANCCWYYSQWLYEDFCTPCPAGECAEGPYDCQNCLTKATCEVFDYCYWFGTTYQGKQIYEYYNTGDDASDSFSPTSWEAQTFTPQISHSIKSIKLKLYRVGLPGLITATIRTTSAGKPTATILATGTINGNEITDNSSGLWYEIVLTSEAPLTNGVKYAIVLKSDNAVAGNYGYWRQDVSDPTYEGGSMGEGNDSGWTMYPAYDHMFEEYSVEEFEEGSCRYGTGQCNPGLEVQFCTNQTDCENAFGYWYDDYCWLEEKPSLISWEDYYAQYGDYATSSAWINSMALSTTKFFESIGGFLTTFKNFFDLKEAYQRGNLGTAIPVARGYLKIFDQFLGNLPIGDFFMFALVFMLAVGVFRIVIKIFQLIKFW